MHQVAGRDNAVTRDLADAVLALGTKPREQRWTSLSLCILDAVWSVGARYDGVVVPLVRNYASDFGVDAPTVSDTAFGPDPLPLLTLAGLQAESLADKTNRHRTSTRGGILKADAALRHVAVFAEHGVTTLADAIELLANTDRFAIDDSALRRIPGEGGSGIRRGYLWMLVGNDDLIKPDRTGAALAGPKASTSPRGARRTGRVTHCEDRQIVHTVGDRPCDVEGQSVVTCESEPGAVMRSSWGAVPP